MQHELKEKIDQRNYIFKRVCEMLISALDLDCTCDDLDPDTPLFGTGLGLDSVDAVMIIVDLESEFGIILDESESMVALRTINSLVDVVLDKMKNEPNNGI